MIRKFGWIFLSIVVLAVLVFIGFTLIELGFNEFNYPGFFFAEAVGVILVIVGIALITGGILFILHWWRRLRIHEEKPVEDQHRFLFK